MWAEAALGEVLGSIDSSHGGTVDGKKGGSQKTLPPDIDKKTSHYAQELARHPQVIASVVAEAYERGEIIPVRGEVLKRPGAGTLSRGATMKPWPADRRKKESAPIRAAITADDVMRLEHRVAEIVREVDDLAVLQEWRARAAALEAYLRSKELQRPMLGAQRRVEARIGELLGEAKRGRPHTDNPTHAEDIRREGDRADFRILSRGFGLLTDDEWRLALVLPPHMITCHPVTNP